MIGSAETNVNGSRGDRSIGQREECERAEWIQSLQKVWLQVVVTGSVKGSLVETVIIRSQSV
jgi:hypothetical protein